MRNILALRQQATLQALAAPGTLLGFDYDGTLAPLVAARSEARLRLSTRRLLAALARLYPCVVISGRRRDEVLAFVDGIGFREVVGNHGAEWGERSKYDEQIARLVSGWVEPLKWSVSRLEGVELEDKKYSLALHYRRAANPAEAVRRLRLAVEDLPVSRVVPGILTLNVVPAIAPDKGGALVALLKRYGAERALFVGDDVTDEDAFALGPQRGVSALRIGKSRASRATFYLPSQRMIDELLRRLCEIRSADQRLRRGAA